MKTDQLAEMAKSHSICDPGLQRILSSNDKESLLEYYLEGIDFCLEHNFPSKDYLKANGDDLLARYGIFIDEAVQLTNQSICVLLGTCRASIELTEYSVSRMYIKHESEAVISLTGNSFAIIDIFDGSKLNIDASGNSKAVVNVYGDAVAAIRFKENAQVREIRKNKVTY